MTWNYQPKGPPPRPTGTVIEYARELLLVVVGFNEYDRPVGLTYPAMLRAIKSRFPVVTYRGPHTGKRLRMNVKQLREIAYVWQAEDRSIRYPIRPRERRNFAKNTIVRPAQGGNNDHAQI